MSFKHKTVGLVFSKKESGESDRIFYLFTQDFGKIEIFGKALRKMSSKLKSGIDLFYFVEVEFIEGKNRKTLTDSLILKKYKNINSDLDKLRVAIRMSDLLESFIKGQQKDEYIFNLLDEFLGRLDKMDGGNLKLESLYYYFLWNFLAGLGYAPQVFKCACCLGKLDPYNIYFSFKDGGVICGNCDHSHSGYKVNSDTVKILRVILKRDLNMFLKIKIEPDSKKILKEISQFAVQNFCPA